MEVSEPATKEDFEKYYRLRWEVLRKPWKQPPGSEKDKMEDKAIHAFIKNKRGEVIASGRLHFNNSYEAQVRYMAVAEKYRGKNYGAQILKYLEQKAKERGVSKVILQARDIAVEFYKRNGYETDQETFMLYNSIQHYLMHKLLK